MRCSNICFFIQNIFTVHVDWNTSKTSVTLIYIYLDSVLFKLWSGVNAFKLHIVVAFVMLNRENSQVSNSWEINCRDCKMKVILGALSFQMPHLDLHSLQKLFHPDPLLQKQMMKMRWTSPSPRKISPSWYVAVIFLSLERKENGTNVNSCNDM